MMIVALALALAAPTHAAAPPPTKPHLLYILADDFGWADAGAWCWHHWCVQRQAYSRRQAARGASRALAWLWACACVRGSDALARLAMWVGLPLQTGTGRQGGPRQRRPT